MQAPRMSWPLSSTLIPPRRRHRSDQRLRSTLILAHRRHEPRGAFACRSSIQLTRTRLNPLLMFLDPRREHVDVLHHARPGAAVGTGAVEQRLMPDDEIAGAAADGAGAQGVKVLLSRVGAPRQRLQPGFAPALES